VDKFSNKDVQRISGLSHRQVIYLAEKGIVSPELEDASGRGTTRWYSRRDMAKFLFARVLRDAGLDFPALGIVTTVLSGFYDELDRLLHGATRDVPTVLNFVDGRLGFLSTADGKPRTKVFEVTEDGRARLARKTAAQVLKTARVNVMVYLDRAVQSLKGE
jgi:hypothetical protein